MFCEKHQEEKVLWGKKAKCRSCNREYQRKWFSENREVQQKRIRANAKKALTRNRLWIWNFLEEHPCEDCGERDPLVLEFDHIDPETKTSNVSRLRDCSLEVLVAEVEKCRVLCANCHRRRTAEQFGFYSYMPR